MRLRDLTPETLVGCLLLGVEESDDGEGGRGVVVRLLDEPALHLALQPLQGVGHISGAVVRIVVGGTAHEAGSLEQALDGGVQGRRTRDGLGAGHRPEHHPDLAPADPLTEGNRDGPAIALAAAVPGQHGN